MTSITKTYGTVQNANAQPSFLSVSVALIAIAIVVCVLSAHFDFAPSDPAFVSFVGP